MRGLKCKCRNHICLEFEPVKQSIIQITDQNMKPTIKLFGIISKTEDIDDISNDSDNNIMNIYEDNYADIITSVQLKRIQDRKSEIALLTDYNKQHAKIIDKRNYYEY